MNKILLIDGNSLAYRGFYATAYASDGMLTTKSGVPTNAILSMNNMLSAILFSAQPTHVLIAFDAAKKTKRHDLFKDYKGGRSKTPAELISQFPLIKEMIEKMNIKWYETIGWEADDIIGTMAKLSAKNDFKVEILSSDKDLLQLVDDNVDVLFNNKGIKNIKRYNMENFYELTGHKPSQVIDIKGIMGDSSDNLPGVKGIGEKGANKLIEEFNNLENIYINIEKIAGSTKTKLEDSKKSAIMCKKIATLNCELDLPFNIEDTKYRFEISLDLMEFFEKYELNSLIKKFGKYSKNNVKKGEKISVSKYKNIVI